MGNTVFISYSRATALKQARALHDALRQRGIEVFLDEREIEPGNPFPEDLADSLLKANVVFIFADSTYFGKPWCVYEYNVVLASLHVTEDVSNTDHVVIALPNGDLSKVTGHLPPTLARRSWPTTDQLSEQITLVVQKLHEVTQTLADRLKGVDDPAVLALSSGGAIQRAASLAGVPGYLGHLPDTLQERFRGRTEELWLLFNALETNRAGGTTRSCVLQGVGGVGKTQLAAEYVWRYGPMSYPGGIVWIDAEGDEENLREQFRGVLRSFKREPKNKVSEPTLTQLSDEITQLFSAIVAEAPVLWVVDNIPEPSKGEGAKSLSYWCPAAKYVALLATTRRAQTPDAESVIVLNELPIRSAIELLTQPEVERDWLKAEEWETIVRWVGCLPLAIQILHTSLGFAGVKEVLAKARGEEPAVALDYELDALREEVPAEYLRGVADCFHDSYLRLREYQDLCRVAHCFAFLSPVPVSEEALLGLATPKILGKLTNRGWIQAAISRGDSPNRHWRMHRLTASYLRTVWPARDDEITMLCNWLRDGFQPTAPTRELSQKYRPHLMFVFGVMAWWGQEHPDSEVAHQIRDLGEYLVKLRPEDETLRGVRYLAIDLLDAIGALDGILEWLEELYRTAPEAIVAGIPHWLQKSSSDRAAKLFQALLADPRDRVRWQAIIHAPSSPRSDILAQPLLEAILAEPNEAQMQQGITGYANLLESETPGLRIALSSLVRYLNEGDLSTRRASAEILGRILDRLGETLTAGGFRGIHLTNLLQRCSIEDEADEVREITAEWLGRIRSEQARAAFSEMLITEKLPWREIDATEKKEVQTRVLRAFQRFMWGAEVSHPNLEITYDDEGQRVFHLNFGDRQPDPKLAQPVVDFAMQRGHELTGLALEVALASKAGKLALVDTALKMLEAQEYAQVIQFSNDVLEQVPDLPSAFWWRGMAFKETGRRDAALADLSSLIELTPEFVDAYVERGELFAQAGCRPEAIQDYSTYLAAQPDDLWALEQRHNLLVAEQRFEEALVDIDAILSQIPDNPWHQHQKTACLLNLQRWEEAADTATKAIALDDTVAEFYLFRAYAQAARGLLEEALQDCVKAFELDSEDARTIRLFHSLAGLVTNKPDSGDSDQE
jgi:tetratricopeptide (TPR) repeat protein